MSLYKVGVFPGPLHAHGQHWCVADLKWEVSAGNSLETLVNHCAKFMPEFMNPVCIVENLTKVVVILDCWFSQQWQSQATTDTDAGKYLM